MFLLTRLFSSEVFRLQFKSQQQQKNVSFLYQINLLSYKSQDADHRLNPFSCFHFNGGWDVIVSLDSLD